MCSWNGIPNFKNHHNETIINREDKNLPFFNHCAAPIESFQTLIFHISFIWQIVTKQRQ